MHQEELNDDSDVESLEDQINIYDVKHEELLGKRRPHHDGSQVEFETSLGERFQDQQYHWLLKKDYLVDIEQLRKHISVAWLSTLSQKPPKTLTQVGDVSILNAGQRQAFDRVVNHYLYSPDTQLLLHLDGVAGSGKSTLIEMILSHLAYHGAKQGDLDPVLRTAPTRVAAFNIHGSTLHQLLSLPVNRSWYELGGEKLVALQAEFRRCKLLIVNEKSMGGFKMLHYIDIRLRSIMARPTDFFGGKKFYLVYYYSTNFTGMNILLCGDFAQLSPVGDNALYTLPVASKASVVVMAGKTSYNAFKETVVLTEVM